MFPLEAWIGSACHEGDRRIGPTSFLPSLFLAIWMALLLSIQSGPMAALANLGRGWCHLFLPPVCGV